MTPDERYASWLEQIDRIAGDVVSLHHNRQIFRRVGEITEHAALPPSTFFDALTVWYGTSQTVALRRLVDRRRGSVSLRRLLEDLLRNPEVMSADRHVRLWLEREGGQWTDADGRGSYRRYADDTDERLDKAAVRSDRDRVLAAVTSVERYVDEHIAHRALESIADVPTWGQIDAAIDTVAEIVNKYAGLLKAEQWVTFEPVIQHDWEAPFRRAWLREE